MVCNATKISANSVVDAIAASPAATLLWSETALPQTKAEAATRALAVADAIATLYSRGETCADVWRGEMLAVAKANPDHPEVALGYAAGTVGTMEVFVRERRADLLSGLRGEIDQVYTLYPASEDIAVWCAEALWQHMRCLARIEALDALRLCAGFKDLSAKHPTSLALAEYLGKALALAIRLQNQATDDEANDASSSGQIISLDAAASDYGALQALAMSFPGSMTLVRMQAEAALQLCGAFAAYGQSLEASRWLDETRKLHEYFPDCEDTAFSYIYSLGMMIASMKNEGCAQEAERCRRLAEQIVSGTFRENVRLRKEFLAVLLDLMGFYIRIGRTADVERLVPEVIKGTEGLEAKDRLKFILAALRQQLVAYLDVHDLAAAERVFDTMRAYEDQKLREYWNAFMTESGYNLIRVYCRAARFDEAERTLQVLTATVNLEHDTVCGARDSIRDLRRNFEAIGLPELGGTRFTDWFAACLSSVEPASGKLSIGDSNQAERLIEALTRLVELQISVGADIKAGEYYRLVRTIAGLFPGDVRLAFWWMDAGLRMMSAHASGPYPRHSEALSRELLDGLDRFPGDKLLRVARIVTLQWQHRAYIAARENESAENALRKLAEAYQEDPSDRNDARSLSDALSLQMRQYLVVGQASKIAVHFTKLKEVYDTHPGEDVGQHLVDAALTLGGYYLSNRREEALLEGLVESTKEHCDKHGGDMRLLALWNQFSDKLGMLRMAKV